MYAPCVYLSSISCVNRLPPVSSLDSPRSHGPVTSAGLQAATRRVCVPMLGLCTNARHPRAAPPIGPRGVSLNRLG